MAKTNTKFKETELGPIPEEWEVLPIYELAEWINGLAFKNIHFTREGMPVIKINELKYGITEQTQFTLDVFDEDYHLRTKDLLFSWSGSPETSIDAFWYNLPDGWLNQHIFKVKPRSAITNEFLFYLLKANKPRLIDIARDKQTTGLGHVTVGDLKRFDVALPSLAEQKSISSILSSLDDKIELNRQINATLEKIASALFKRWFVDFEFPDKDGKPYKSNGGKMVESEMGEIPEGWRVEALDDVASFLNGLALQKYPPENDNEFIPVIKIRELKSGITDSTDKASTKIENEYIVENGDVLFSWSGSLDVAIWCGGRGALNQHLFKVTSEKYPKWFYYRWLKYFIPTFQTIAADKAVTMGHIKREHLTESKVLIPCSDTLEKMNETMQPLLEDIVRDSLETHSLTWVRDLLMPKLLIGRLRTV